MDPIIIVEGLKKIYSNGSNKIVALNGIDLSINKGEFISIVGASGSGKSTLLNILGGLDTPTSCVVQVQNVNIENLTAEELAVFRRRHIGFIFQNYNLIPVLNVYENIVFPLQLDNREIDKAFIYEIASKLKISEKMYQIPSMLSGGQQQRVAIARALCAKPSIILADEPTGNLDSETGREVMKLICVMTKQYHQTMAVVTHNKEVADAAHRIIHIKDGKISEIYNQEADYEK